MVEAATFSAHFIAFEAASAILLPSKPAFMYWALVANEPDLSGETTG